MSTSQSVNWLWIQYTPGAGGKFFASLSQLCENVDKWDNDLVDNTEVFTKERLLMSLEDRILLEPRFTYDLSYFTRQLPMTRGDDMTLEEANKKFYELNPSIRYDKNMHLETQWHKPYLPKWFDGKVITLDNDEKSMEWLRKRRDACFYKWEGDKVIHKRFHPQYIPGKQLAKKYFDTTTIEEHYTNKDDFYKKYFYQDPEVYGLIEPIKEYDKRLKINLSDLLYADTKDLLEPVCEFLQSTLDFEKARYIHELWKIQNLKILD